MSYLQALWHLLWCSKLVASFVKGCDAMNEIYVLLEIHVPQHGGFLNNFILQKYLK